MKIAWDQDGTRKYEAGVDHGVLYQDYGGIFTNGVPWNGLISVDGEDNGSEITPLYTGDVKNGLLRTPSEYGGTITAYTYPDEFESCIGSNQVLNGVFLQQQGKSRFGLSYRTFIGNDTDGPSCGYKLHLIYAAEVTNNSISRSTLNDSPEALEFEWEFESIPQLVDGFDPFSVIVIDSTKFDDDFLSQLSDILYGTDEEEPRLPTLEELIELFTVIDRTIPPEYVGYPYQNLYPSGDIYPGELAQGGD